jgi:hypothetical protein
MFHDLYDNGYDIIWLICDEPDWGGPNWYASPKLCESFNSVLKNEIPGTISYLDLFGNLKGNKYLFERGFKIDTGKELNEVDMSDTSCLPADVDPMDLATFRYTHDYKNVNNLSIKEQELRYYKNVLYTAQAYKNTSDIMGVNCYSSFYVYPEYAGKVVDAIKEACGTSKPVWNYFDGYQYRRNYSIEVPLDEASHYLKQIKCQVYTSIAHGATGVLFFTSNAHCPTQEYWDGLLLLADELKTNSWLFKSSVVEQGQQSDEHLHYIKYKVNENEFKVIVTNTDSKVHNLSLPEINKNILPLEVQILDINENSSAEQSWLDSIKEAILGLFQRN